jgi:hypothetical protein
MKRTLSIYQYVAPLVLGPLSFFLWRREYAGELRMLAVAWLIPILWAYIVPGIGTNVLKVWEFDTRLRLGRFRPHHGFVFGSATATLGWLVHTTAQSGWDVARNAFVLCCVLGFVNLLYEVKALQSGILRVYNQPWADGRGPVDVALDYAPWFFGGFGAIYGAGIATMELIEPRWSATIFAVTLLLALIVPTAGYIVQSILRHGHWGTRPVLKKCPNV